MSLSPFLTELDERAKVRGSRDPLGVQPVWDSFGRGLIGNLTTISSSVRDFKELLLGYWFVGRIVRDDDAKTSLAVFLRWEQLASYARALRGDEGFRGTERVRKTLAARPATLRIAADAQSQILTDQQRYGLWGLFSVPAQNSGLLTGTPRRLTPAALGLVESQYKRVLDANPRSHSDRITKCLAGRSWVLDHQGVDRELLATIGKLLVSPLEPAEQEFYREHLLYGGPGNPVRREQQVFTDVLTEQLEVLEDDWTPAALEGLARGCERNGSVGATAAERLRDIVACESVLAPSACLFDHLLAKHGQPLSTVVSGVRLSWGAHMPSVRASEFSELRQRIRRGSPSDDTAERWLRLAPVLAKGDFQEAIRLLLEQNLEIASVRGGAPWVTVEAGKLRVMMRDGEEGALPKRSELTQLWRHAYFLSSTRDIARALAPGAAR